VISPFLANVYLHYVLDLWVTHWRKQRAQGDVSVVRYADDFVMGFQHRLEAERCLLVWAGSATRWAVSGLAFCDGAVRNFVADVGNTWHG
jgi:hypothetical protein